MATQKTNPFNISFGKMPVHPVARHDEFQTVIDTFDNENPETNSYLLTGPRGCGKTAMLTEIKSYYEGKKGWLTVDLLPDGDILQSLASQLYSIGKMKRLFVEAEFSFSFQGFGISIGTGEKITDTLTFLSKELEHLKKKKTRLLLTLDEAVANASVRTFTLAFQRFLREGYEVFLVMTGLYRNISSMQNEKTLTFLHRAPRIHLGPLYLPAIKRSYQTIFGTSDEKAVELAKFTKGYAYAFQLLGSILFKRGTLDIDEDVLDEFDQTIFARSYSVIWEELSPKQRALLRLAEASGTIENETVVRSGIMSAGEIAVYKDRLIKEGLIERSGRGVVRFVLPRFNVFVAQMNLYS